MKTEQELQNDIEKGLAGNHTIDTKAYSLVFSALKKEPDYHVSLSFADRIISLLEKKEEKRDYWWIGIGIFLSVIALIITLAITKTQWTAGVFTFLSGYSGLVAFGIAFILLLHWIDKKVIKKQLSIKAH
jgi:high-affinity K+ transport system ATPase subunit B